MAFSVRNWSMRSSNGSRHRGDRRHVRRIISFAVKRLHSALQQSAQPGNRPGSRRCVYNTSRPSLNRTCTFLFQNQLIHSLTCLSTGWSAWDSRMCLGKRDFHQAHFPLLIKWLRRCVTAATRRRVALLNISFVQKVLDRNVFSVYMSEDINRYDCDRQL